MERRGLELYQKLKKLLRMNIKILCLLVTRYSLSKKWFIGGSSKADKTSYYFDKICGTQRPLVHKTNIEDEMNNKNRKHFSHKNGEIMPIEGIEIVDSIEKEIALGNFFQNV